MTTVLVHGIPETADVWAPLLPALERAGVGDTVTLAPPGFGARLPDDWGATHEEYVDWLAGELRRIGGPIDLLGHDMGAGLTFGIAAAHPDLIRSWTADVAGILHPDYEWHDAARTWQTPGDGESAVEMMLALSPTELAATYVHRGMPQEIAVPVATAFDADMGRCILGFYRSALGRSLAELAGRLSTSDRRPSLLVDPTDDVFVPSALTPAVAQRLGSSVLTLVGRGHWWMVSDPDTAATGLREFWSAVR